MKDYLIIGNSAAGISAAREIRSRDSAGRITILSDESWFAYSRVLLPLYLAGKISKREMVIAPKSFYASLGIRLLRKDPAARIDVPSGRVHTETGVAIPYDSLLVATGASPRKLGIPGENLPGVHSLRKISDVDAIRENLASSAGAVVLAGGGLVSLKSLEALLNKRRAVHLVISSGRILSQMLDRTASDLFLDRLASRGVRIHLGTEIRSFEGNGRLKAALLSDGSALPCGLAIIGKGVRPNVDFLQGSGILLGVGAKVDNNMATNVPGIYAAGDVAEPHPLQGNPLGVAIWPLAVEGGRVAGGNMACEGSASLTPIVRMNTIDVLGSRVVSVGNGEGEREMAYLRREKGIYRKLVFSASRLSGFLLAGDIHNAGVLTSLVKTRVEVSSSILEEGLERGFSYSSRLRAFGGSIQIRQM